MAFKQKKTFFFKLNLLFDIILNILHQYSPTPIQYYLNFSSPISLYKIGSSEDTQLIAYYLWFIRASLSH